MADTKAPRDLACTKTVNGYVTAAATAWLQALVGVTSSTFVYTINDDICPPKPTYNLRRYKNAQQNTVAEEKVQLVFRRDDLTFGADGKYISHKWCLLILLSVFLPNVGQAVDCFAWAAAPNNLANADAENFLINLTNGTYSMFMFPTIYSTIGA